MKSEKRYYVKRRLTALLLIVAVVSLVYLIIRLEDVKQILTSDGMPGLLFSLFLFFVAFCFMRGSISITDDSIIHHDGLWLAKQKKLQYLDITKVYKFGLLPDSYYVVEGKAGNKSTRIQIPVFINGWIDILRTVVSKVDAKIVDKRVLKMLGFEAPVTYLGSEAPVTCNGNSVSHEKSCPQLMLFTHVYWFIRNSVTLFIALMLSGLILKAVEPHSGILTIAICSLFLIVAFFLVGYQTRAWRWIHLSLVTTLFVIIAYLNGPRNAVFMFRLSLFFLHQWLLVASFCRNTVNVKRVIRRIGKGVIGKIRGVRPAHLTKWLVIYE